MNGKARTREELEQTGVGGRNPIISRYIWVNGGIVFLTFVLFSGQACPPNTDDMMPAPAPVPGPQGPPGLDATAAAGAGVTIQDGTVSLDFPVVDARYWMSNGNMGTAAGADFIGTADDQPLELRVNNLRALRLEPNAIAPNLLGGFAGNSIENGVVGATIAGGGDSDNGGADPKPNRVTDNFGTIGGGRGNQAGNDDADALTATGPTVAGGLGNSAGNIAATVGGGVRNTAGGIVSTVAGGQDNTAGGASASVGGGFDNVANGDVTTIAGGFDNSANGNGATIGGGSTNSADGNGASIGGGSLNTADGLGAVVGGGLVNGVTSDFGTIAGGGLADQTDIASGNRVTDDYGSIGGGGDNQAGDGDAITTNTRFATVGGGESNSAGGQHSTIGGGNDNMADGSGATIGGGIGNMAGDIAAVVGGGLGNSAGGEFATVGGGESNTASGKFATVGGGGPSVPGDPTTANRATANFCTVGGGGDNQASTTCATVGGGLSNRATARSSTVGGGEGNTAIGHYTTVSGGIMNSAGGPAASRSTVCGGGNNTASVNAAAIGGGTNNHAAGLAATVPGGDNNTAIGSYSFAAGRRAKASHTGSFVWGDSTDDDIFSSANDTFTVRSTGGARFISGTFNPNTGVVLASGGGMWQSISDRNAKENFEAVDTQEVLQRLAAIQIETWNYKAQDDDIRHIGPMAQDFAAAFGVGHDNKHIGTLDADGVALAAIQGLHNIVKQRERELAAQKRETHALQARITALEGLVTKLAAGRAPTE